MLESWNAEYGEDSQRRGDLSFGSAFFILCDLCVQNLFITC
jgi:hypothetical protein